MREIIITVGRTGDSKIETKGFAGSECLKETIDIERKLGAKTKDVHTAEMRSQSATNTAKVGR